MYNITEPANISAVLLGKIDKYGYLTGKRQILFSGPSQTIEEVNK